MQLGVYCLPYLHDIKSNNTSIDFNANVSNYVFYIHHRDSFVQLTNIILLNNHYVNILLYSFEIEGCLLVSNLILSQNCGTSYLTHQTNNYDSGEHQNILIAKYSTTYGFINSNSFDNTDFAKI